MKGIYCIENLVNGKKYIGSSQNVFKRRNRHFSELNNNKHKNTHFQNAYNKHGKENFLFYVIEEVLNEKELIVREQFYLNSSNQLYNINLIANSSLGVKRSDETKEKVRQANLGLKHPEWRNEIKSQAQGGDNHWTKTKSFSDEAKANMSEAQKKLYDNGYVSPIKGKKTPIEIIEALKLKLSKPVLQFSLEGIFIREWKSAKEAALYGFNSGHIGQCCLNKEKKHKNFIWKFKEKK